MFDIEENICFKYAVNKLGKVFIICYENERVYHAYPLDYENHNKFKHYKYGTDIKLKDQYSLKGIDGGLQYLKEELEVIYTSKHMVNIMYYLYNTDYVRNKVMKLIKYLLENKEIKINVTNLNITNTDEVRNTIEVSLFTTDIDSLFCNKVCFHHLSTDGCIIKIYDIEYLYEVCYYTIIAMLYQKVNGRFVVDSVKEVFLDNCSSLTTPSLDLSKLYFLIPTFLNETQGGFNYNFKVIDRLVMQAEKQYNNVFTKFSINKYYFILLYIVNYYVNISTLDKLGRMTFEKYLENISNIDLLIDYFYNLSKYKELIIDIENKYLK